MGGVKSAEQFLCQMIRMIQFVWGRIFKWKPLSVVFQIPERPSEFESEYMSPLWMLAPHLAFSSPTDTSTLNVDITVLLPLGVETPRRHQIDSRKALQNKLTLNAGITMLLLYSYRHTIFVKSLSVCKSVRSYYFAPYNCAPLITVIYGLSYRVLYNSFARPLCC